MRKLGRMCAAQGPRHMRKLGRMCAAQSPRKGAAHRPPFPLPFARLVLHVDGEHVRLDDFGHAVGGRDEEGRGRRVVGGKDRVQHRH